MFIGTVVYAVINSVILALLAIGFNLTFGISGVANFAYGALYVFSAYLSWMLLNLLGLPFFLSAIISIFITTLIGALMYRFVLQRVRGQALSEVIATFGIGLAILLISTNSASGAICLNDNNPLQCLRAGFSVDLISRATILSKGVLITQSTSAPLSVR